MSTTDTINTSEEVKLYKRFQNNIANEKNLVFKGRLSICPMEPVPLGMNKQV